MKLRRHATIPGKNKTPRLGARASWRSLGKRNRTVLCHSVHSGKSCLPYITGRAQNRKHTGGDLFFFLVQYLLVPPGVPSSASTLKSSQEHTLEWGQSGLQLATPSNQNDQKASAVSQYDVIQANMSAAAPPLVIRVVYDGRIATQVCAPDGSRAIKIRLQCC